MKKLRRQMTQAAVKFFDSLRCVRSTRMRKGISLALCLTLVLVPMLGKGRLAPAKVQAQEITVCGAAVPPLGNRIIQPCFSPLSSIHTQGLENQVIDNLLTAHELPPTDKSRLLGWERNLIRAGLFNKILGYIQTPPASRSESEQFFVTKLTELVKARRVLAATKALDEYNRWASNPCTYVPPAGFSYTLHCSCFVQTCGIFGGPTPPSFEEFQNYGASIAYADFQTKPELQAIAGDTARNLGILGGFVAVGLAGVIGGAIGASLTVSSAIIVAIHPFLAAAVAGTNSAAAVAGVSGVAAGVTGAVSIAAVAAIVILAVVIGVLQGITVFTAAEIPGKLLEAKNSAINTNIDLAQLMTTDTGKREVYAEFIQATTPEASAATEIPAVSASDRQFLLTPGDIVTPILQYKDWGGINRSARLSGGWFVDREGSTGAERLTLSINYLDWTGKAWTASRVGKQFLHTRNGDATATPTKTPEIKYKNWSDAQFTATINNAAPTITLTSATARQGAGLVISQDVGSVGDQDDPVSSLAVSVISENPSNGVSFGLFTYGNPLQALVTASCTASNASFTLKVTDPGGKSATATIDVTVTANDPPVLSYLPPPSLIVGTSLPSYQPLLPLSDPDGFFAPTIGTPTISPAVFTGSVTASPAGVLTITNVGPPGLYTIKVPASDSCTTTNAELKLNVTCPVITASVGGGGYICPGSSSTVSVNVSGGTAPYTVKLSDGQMKTSSSLPITFTVSPSVQTTYTATATDAYGCPATVTGSAVVMMNTLPTLGYTNQSLGVGKTAFFYPSSGPGDNIGIASIALQKVTPSTGLSLSVNNKTGVVSVGSATVAGTYSVEVVATNSCGAQRVASFNVTTSCMTTTLGTLANGQAGIAYNRTITASPAGAYSFAVASGALPPGLALDESTGAVTGTPTTTGTFNFSVRATASSGCSATKSYSLVISCPAVTITPTTLPAGSVGVAYNQMLSAAPAGNYGFAVSFGSLPLGMKLNAVTGELSGTPTMKGSYYITIRAGGFGACTGTRTYMLVIQ